MLRKIDQTGFDSDSEEEEQQMTNECTHSMRNTLCPHCQKKFCSQCEFLHKFRIKKEMETLLDSCENKLMTLQMTDSGTILANTKGSLEKANQELRDRLNCRIASILQSIMTTNRRERYRVMAEARKLGEDRAARHFAILSEAKTSNFDGMKPAELDSWIEKLENLAKEVDDQRFLDEFAFYENPVREEAIRRFLETKPIFKLEKAEVEELKSVSTNFETGETASGFDKNLYSKIRVVAKVSGDDMFGDVIRSPIGVARVIVRDETVLAVVHGCRISLFSLRGKLVDTLKIRNKESGSDFLLSGDVVSEPEIGTLYLAARSGRSSCVYKVELARDRRSKTPTESSSVNSANLISPTVFVQLKGRISGLAISKTRGELFTIVDDEIQCFLLKDGTQQPFTHKIYQGGSTGHLNSKLHCMVDSKSLLVYTKDAGRELCVFNLNSKTEQRLLKPRANDNTTDIRGAVVDPIGNVIVMHRQANIQVIAAGTTESIIGELSSGHKWDLRGITMFTGPSQQNPVIAVTDQDCHQVILFSI